MSTPPLLMFAALAFWGWQTGAMLFALIMGVLLELSRAVALRWEFSQKEYNRIWDLCGLLFLGAALYCYTARDDENLVAKLLESLNWTERNRHMTLTVNSSLFFFQWWPMIFFPFAAAQAYGSRDRHPASTFFYFLRRQEKKTARKPAGGVNVSHVYLAICLLAASASAHRDSWFYAGFSAIAVWTLWFIRPNRFAAWIWVGGAVAVALTGHWSHRRLHELQRQVEDGIMQLVTNWVNRRADPLKSHTAIGHIGELKLSGKIMLRVRQEAGPVPPLILDSAYSLYHKQNWFAGRGKEFEMAPPENDTTTWTLGSPHGATNSVIISMPLSRGEGLLPLPGGTWQLADLIVGEVKRNRNGVVQVSEGPGLTAFSARHHSGPTPRLAPLFAETGQLEDLMIPAIEQEVISRIGGALQLRSLPNDEAKIAAIEGFFARDFTYSTYQDISARQLPAHVSPLAHFLETTRSGHCEFFGTASALLLRYAGIPARYANGYSVHEIEDSGDRRYVVRERHGHAWALRWSAAKGRWIDFDTTPAGWQKIEDEANASFLEPLSDLIDRIKHAISSWWWGSRDGRFQQYLAGALILLVVFLFWRLLRRRRGAPAAAAATTNAQADNWPGRDSEFYLVEQRLLQAGLSRYPGETLGIWLTRLRAASTGFNLEPLPGLLKLHYRRRFDPEGLNQEDRRALRDGVSRWLAADRNEGSAPAASRG